MSEADAAAGVNKNGKDSPRSSEVTSSIGEATTTRQRRIQLQYHSTNGLWEQPQPRIKKASQREAAYLRSSGLVPTSKASKVGEAKVFSNTVPSNAANKDNDDVTRHFARQLGSTDARIRHQTIRQLKAYLKVRSDVKNDGLSEMDLIKLWKCFWYTLYLADRVPVQEELCQQLCSLIWSVAGTMEQDEYIAQSYLDSINESEFGDEDEGEYDDDDMDNVEDEDMEEVDMERGDDDDDDDDDIIEDNEIDFEAKQLALLEEEEGEDEADPACEDCTGCNNCDDDSNNYDVDIDDQDDEDDDVDPMDVRHCQGAHLAALFARTFWRTCVREWGKMDKYRVDKFYTCLRYMLAVMYDYMASRHWSLGIINLFNDALHEEVLLQVPNGVRYHIVDCCLEELCKAVQRSGGIPLTEATFIDVLEPFFALAQTGDGDDPLQQRVLEQVLLKFINQYSVYSDNYVNHQNERATKEASQSDVLLVFDQVHVGTISQFIFEIAADDAVAKDEYRKALYSVHKQYERRIREIGPENDVDIGGESGTQYEIEGDDENLEDAEFADGDDDDDTDQKQAVQGVIHSNKGEIKQASNISPASSVTKKRTAKADESVPSTGITINNDKSSMKPTNHKKDKKQKQDAHEFVEDRSAIAAQEEVVTISKADQKAARAAMNVKVETNVSSNKRRNDRINRPQIEGSQKRVKFGDNNRARSYKASMDGLTKLVVKPILQKSPERSILLKTDNKNKIIAINHQQQQSATTPRQQQLQRLQNNKNKRNNQHTGNNRNRNKGRKSAKDYF